MKEFQQNDIEFVHIDHDDETFHAKDLIELFPLSLSFTHDLQRPFLLLRDAKNEVTLSVALTPLEAGIFVAQNQNRENTPHHFLAEILRSFDIQIRQCVFVQIQSQTQHVRVYFSGHPLMNSMKLKADQAISVCLHFGVPFFATREFIQKSSLLKAAPPLKNRVSEGNTFFVEHNQKYLV